MKSDKYFELFAYVLSFLFLIVGLHEGHPNGDTLLILSVLFYIVSTNCSLNREIKELKKNNGHGKDI